MDGPRSTPVAEIAGIVEATRRVFDSGRSKPLEWRIRQLQGIRRLADENKDAITAALQADLRRPKLECVLAEAMTVIAEADEAIKHVRTWAKHESAVTPAVLVPGSSYIQREPLGVVLIIGAWNFPIQLLLNPLVSAVAAGNVAVLKPSEVSPASASLIEALLPRYVDADAFRFVQGAVAETTELLRQRFDHICYTGNGAVASIVMTAAARYLTPVTLELGGKSPCIVDKDADLDVTANRIVVGKALNAGQVCLSPDYVLAHRDVVDRLTEKMVAAAKRMYCAGSAAGGAGAGSSSSSSSSSCDMRGSPDFGRIVNGRHFARVKALLDGAGGRVVFGGESDASQNYIALTLIREPKLESAVMKEEIFGPLLPIVAVDDVEAAMAFVRARPKPLALYVFTGSSSTANRVLEGTSSGGAVVNDCILHNAVSDMPFGGVGPSGMGAYHGRWGFENFSHRKAVFKQPTFIDAHKLMYPPYSDRQLGLLQFLFNSAPPLPRVSLKDVALVGLAAATALLAWKVHTLTGGAAWASLTSNKLW